MKDQVVLPPSGEICIAIPLFRIGAGEELVTLQGYSVVLTNMKPLAYAIEHPAVGSRLFNADFVEKHFEFLGDL